MPQWARELEATATGFQASAESHLPGGVLEGSNQDVLDALSRNVQAFGGCPSSAISGARCESGLQSVSPGSSPAFG